MLKKELKEQDSVHGMLCFMYKNRKIIYTYMQRNSGREGETE